MRKAIFPLLALASVFVWVACDSQPTQLVDVEASFEIWDADSDDNNFMYWLPPMDDNPTATGEFLGSLAPKVVIRELTYDGVEEEWICCGADLATFTMSTGPGSQRVGVDLKGKHYHLNWQTKEDPRPTLGGRYRITVMVGVGDDDWFTIGFADVQIEDNGRDFRSLKTEQTLGLVDGGTLPIKFRIEYGVLDLFDFDVAYHSLTGSDPTNPYLYDIFLLNSDTKFSVNLTNSPGSMDGGPTWSPDGKMIAFTSDRDNVGGEPDIYLLNLVDGWVTRLTRNGGWKPAWGPTWDIAFQRGWPPEDYNQNIWLKKAPPPPDYDWPGTAEVQLTDWRCAEDNDPYEDIDPTWFFGRVSFARTRNTEPGQSDCTEDSNPPNQHITHFDIVSMDLGLDEAQNRPLHNHTWNNAVDQISPAWAPPRLLYEQFGDAHELWIRDMSVNPYAIRPLTSSPAGWENQEADWALGNPGVEDDKILFTRIRPSGEMGLWVMNPHIPLSGDWLLEFNAGGGKWRPASF